MNSAEVTPSTEISVLSRILIFICLIAAIPAEGGKLIPGDTLKIQPDTAEAAPREKRDFFGFPGFDDSFFDFGFNLGFSGMDKAFTEDLSTDLEIAVQDKKVVVTAEIPGADRNDIDIKVTKNTISISAKTKVEETVKDDKGNIISSSTQMRQFSNSRPLPVEVKPKVTRSEYRDGRLVVELTRT